MEAFVARVAGKLKTEPAGDFERFASVPVGICPPGYAIALPRQMPSPHPAPPVSVPPATFEMRFMKLHSEGRFDEMWEMLAEDAKSAWGGRENFARDMPRIDAETELLHMQVVSVDVLDGWTDQIHQRSYRNVARMVMRYQVRQQWREWTFDREVHLVLDAGGWRTLCYPSKSRASVAR